MLDFGWLKDYLTPFSWFLNLGKAEAGHIKEEIKDLLQHCSQSLRSLIELSETLEEIPLEQFTQERFVPISNHCLLFFTSPEGVQKARTHCTDIERDVARIQFKMTKLLRTEDQNWKGIKDAFNILINADQTFLKQYEEELKRIGEELEVTGILLKDGDTRKAWKSYVDLRASLLTTKQEYSNEIAKMQDAQIHVHRLLT